LPLFPTTLGSRCGTAFLRHQTFPRTSLSSLFFFVGYFTQVVPKLFFRFSPPVLFSTPPSSEPGALLDVNSWSPLARMSGNFSPTHSVLQPSPLSRSFIECPCQPRLCGRIVFLFHTPLLQFLWKKPHSPSAFPFFLRCALTPRPDTSPSSGSASSLLLFLTTPSLFYSEGASFLPVNRKVTCILISLRFKPPPKAFSFKGQILLGRRRHF